MTIFDNFLEFFSGRFDTSGSILPRLVPEILILDALCDAAAAGAGIGDSRSFIVNVNVELFRNMDINRQKSQKCAGVILCFLNS